MGHSACEEEPIPEISAARLGEISTAAGRDAAMLIAIDRRRALDKPSVTQRGPPVRCHEPA